MARPDTSIRPLVGQWCSIMLQMRSSMSAAMDSGTKKLVIFVRLLDEGTEVARPTEAIDLGDGLFELLPTPDYSPENEVWEFPPGSTVRAEKRKDYTGEYLIAVKP